jgi:hypothetical protein
MTFIAGPYTVTYNAVDLGISEDGIELEHITYADLVRGDNQGDSVQDGVYRGGDMFLSLTLIEWDKDALHAAMNPYGSTVSTLGEMGQVGRLMMNLAQQIVATPVAGTTAASAALTGPVAMDTLTAAKCILAENFPVRFQMATRLRKVPLRFRILPVQGIWHTWT